MGSCWTGLLAIAVVAVLDSLAVTAPLTDGEIQAVLQGAETRRDAMLRTMIEAPYPPSGCWRHEAFALAAYHLNERTHEGDQALLTERETEFPKALQARDFHWHAYLLERVYFLFSASSPFFPGRMSAAAEAAVLEMLWQWAAPSCRLEMTLPGRDWWIWGSENHHAQAWAGFWGAAVIFSQHPTYRDRRYADGTAPDQMAQGLTDYFKRFARARATRGLLVECNSDYNKYTLGGWYNLADFAPDPVLRQRMNALLDVFWADWALEQLDGIRGGSRHRCYPGRNSTQQSPGDGMPWYHFGLGAPGSKHPAHLCAATTSYRPSPVVVDLALDAAGRGCYEYRSRRPGLDASAPLEPTYPLTAAGKTRKREAVEGIRSYASDPEHPFSGGAYALNPDAGGLARYTYCTPDFVVGTSMVEPCPTEDWTAISSQNRWEGVIFGGHPTARIFTQPLKPQRGSVYNAHWSVQSKGVLIGQRLRATNASGQRIWFDHSLRRVERGGWVFAEAPRAYAAVRVVEGGTVWEPDTADQHYEGKGPVDMGEWLKCEDELSPVILEVVSRTEVADFEAFQSAILANPVKWQGSRLDYASPLHQTELTFFADYSQAPRVDGRPVDYRPQNAYESPYLQSQFGSEIVTVQKGNRRLTLDFGHH